MDRTKVEGFPGGPFGSAVVGEDITDGLSDGDRLVIVRVRG